MTVLGVLRDEGTRLPKGSTFPFRFRDREGTQWVAKAPSQFTGTTEGNLLSELVCGLLARFMNLPWPRVAVCQLTPEVARGLADDGLQVSVPVAVATEFLPDLSDIPEPHQDEPNEKYIATFFSEPWNRPEFYGKSILDLWVGMDDAGKYDQLKVSQEGTPVFLDGDLSDITLLSHPDTRRSLLSSVGTSAFTINAPARYLTGILRRREFFIPWLNQAERFSEEALSLMMGEIPTEFIPPGVGEAELQKLLVARKHNMIEQVRCEVNE